MPIICFPEAMVTWCLVLADKLLTSSRNQRLIDILHAERNCRRWIQTTDKKNNRLKFWKKNAYICVSDGNRVIILPFAWKWQSKGVPVRAVSPCDLCFSCFICDKAVWTLIWLVPNHSALASAAFHKGLGKWFMLKWRMSAVMMSRTISEGTSETHLKLWPGLNESDGFPLLFDPT